jgi:pilus assembly protein CpaB
MSQRVFAILLVAFAVAVGASYVVYRLVQARIGQAAGPTATEIIVAARKLEIGTLVKDQDLKGGQWLGTPPQGIVMKKDDVVGRGVISAINEGEPIFDNRLAAVGAGAGLAATIPPGMRAVAVRVNDVVGVAGFVVSGQRVDVLINGTPPGGAPNGPKVKTLLQNIEVLSAGTNFQKDAEGKPVQVPVVNLLVTPEQAEVLSLASNQTTIQLILRNPLDTEATKTPGSAVATLFGEQKATPAPTAGRPRPAASPLIKPVETLKPPPPPSPYLVEVLNGPKRSEVKFARKVDEKKEEQAQ